MRIEPADSRQLRTFVYDHEPRALEIARHRGFEVEEHSITSRLDLTGLPAPEPSAGVTLESVPDFAFGDPGAVAAVEAMLLASQTNPEAGFGVPAAILGGSVAPDHVFHIDYTGVDPRFRGRGLATLVKQRAHLDAAAAGATVAATSNEVSNHGIRRINAELGYVVESGAYRMRRVLPTS